MTPDYKTIAVEANGSTGVITLNRPEVLNAINTAMLTELSAAFDALESDDTCRVIVITGAGRAFSAGRDIQEIGAAAHRSGNDLWARIEGLAKPVLSAVNGLCYTGALSMVLSTDVVIAADTAVFADTHARFGMYHGGGTTQRLRDRVGPLHAKEILLSSRRLTAAEAERIGLVNRVVAAGELRNYIFALASDIAANDADAVRVTKYLVNEGLRLGSAVGFELEAQEYRAQRERIAAGEVTLKAQLDKSEESR